MKSDCRFRVATARVPGAVGVIELAGDVERVLRGFDSRGRGGRRAWPIGVLRLVRVFGIDDAIVVRTGAHSAMIMPHGGVRIVQAIRDRLVDAGFGMMDALDVLAAHPEAEDLIEALMLEALATASSSLAVELLLAQPARWRAWQGERRESLESVRRRSIPLNRLLSPPKVVVAGAPNCGKSTLMNTLAGRDAAITANAKGTTRDYIGAVIDCAGLTVWWYDTPGIHTGADRIEAEAIRLAGRLIDEADVVILAVEPGGQWVEVDRPVGLRLLLKSDVLGGDAAIESERRATGADVAISAKTGAGIGNLVAMVRESLVSTEALDHKGPWLFDERVVDAL